MAAAEPVSAFLAVLTGCLLVCLCACSNPSVAIRSVTPDEGEEVWGEEVSFRVDVDVPQDEDFNVEWDFGDGRHCPPDCGSGSPLSPTHAFAPPAGLWYRVGVAVSTDTESDHREITILPRLVSKPCGAFLDEDAVEYLLRLARYVRIHAVVRFYPHLSSYPPEQRQEYIEEVEENLVAARQTGRVQEISVFEYGGPLVGTMESDVAGRACDALDEYVRSVFLTSEREVAAVLVYLPERGADTRSTNDRTALASRLQAHSATITDCAARLSEAEYDLIISAEEADFLSDTFLWIEKGQQLSQP